MLPKRLKEIRTEKEKTQQEIANYLGITRPAYTAYESGNRQPDYETLQRLADFFNVTTDFLLGRTDSRNESTPTLDDEITQIMRDLGPDVTLHFYDLKGMTDEEKENLKIFLQGLKARREQKS